jgi:bacillithiol biosynthesis deacetylase BshB1
LAVVDVLCVGAHPDDVEIGMGGTIAGMVRTGLEIAIVDITDGEPTPAGTPELRAEESREAAEVLGVAHRVTLSQPNRYLFDTLDARTELAEVVRELKPRVMFVPYPEDAHPDHIAASQIAVAARFYAKLTKTDMKGDPHYPARIYHYMAVHMRLVRQPSFVMDITQDLATKIRALSAYRSQFIENPGNSDIIPLIEQMAAMWGGLIRVPAGEPFFSEEPVGIRDIESLT